MMVNLDNQRPGDLWKIDGTIYTVIDIPIKGEENELILRLQDQDGNISFLSFYWEPE